MRYQYELTITEVGSKKVVAHRFGGLGVDGGGLLAEADNLAYGLGRLGREAANDLMLNEGFGGDHRAFTAWERARQKKPE